MNEIGSNEEGCQHRMRASHRDPVRFFKSIVCIPQVMARDDALNDDKRLIGSPMHHSDDAA